MEVKVFAVDISTAGEMRLGRPRELFTLTDSQQCAPIRCYDVSKDGRFLFLDGSNVKRASVTRMDLVLNWTATLKKR